jgi:hypothetical protein
VTVRIPEIAGVATEEAVAGGVGDGRSSLCCLRHDVVDFRFGTDIVRYGNSAGVDLGQRNVGFHGERFLWPKCQDQPASHMEEDDGAMLELRAEDSFRLQTHAVSIEGQ